MCPLVMTSIIMSALNKSILMNSTRDEHQQFSTLQSTISRMMQPSIVRSRFDLINSKSKYDSNIRFILQYDLQQIKASGKYGQYDFEEKKYEILVRQRHQRSIV